MTNTDQNKMLQMELKHGVVKIKLRPDLAPLAAERLLTLSQQGFYDDTPFHRVIEGFMAQGGDPSGTGTKGSDLPDLKAEFTKAESFHRGMIGMARTMDPNSANSQFFIMFDNAPHLDGQYTIVGQVIEGMEFVDQIKRGGGANGMVNDPDRIIKMSVINE
ncbi:Peptidyl-prolyl cis-trans isomerase (rotamase) -cyclophilin family (PpiB) (PDB:4DGD) [Commensalibacter communis]|uniref:peptidylprolyl isomerase n=1 Tax=Commensalibacter communis TaxID=2972786 RepID=UPI0022FF8045|nr:peptidylprolyl isomerase [Commensalibacter communis]CAI3923620.1 Peptidyl-prolyl cis-trans isomerase (rotamase) -cyclophilin family (PpiB) (PDB:4DGD) [Commensalibacter communis]CAI3927230.1 Peptidyl-prolyl cis-trans isomerase (rotamase) -cyclophilin family (PpiB) (PDB:4DGD) [Commensalibacter communis]CAI3931297.1 Peptidyl-prolyl cis-trans isomerase (rotamase) -cyclophilin family (PpiB) (PDB:4DGD) [Commensalibacter communis]CAI3931940.1 Peptidyl-prolyl cis-trans isomerase (rotamase) -cyclophi